MKLAQTDAGYGIVKPWICWIRNCSEKVKTMKLWTAYVEVYNRIIPDDRENRIVGVFKNDF